jgi:hypothetical protein
MSLVPERWEFLGWSVDDETGYRIAYVAREKTDFERRLTVWKLMKRPNGWYNMGQWLSTNTFRSHAFGGKVPKHCRPLKLSDSRIDFLLRSFAEHGDSFQPAAA